MLTITSDGNGYKVKASAPGMGWRGFSVKARDLAEVHLAVTHYYGTGDTGADAHHCNSGVDNCPMCRDTRSKVK